MLDLEPLFVGLKAVIASEIGSSLKQVPSDAIGTLGPAIFKDRQKQYKEYPYITIDLLSVKEDGGWLEGTSVNASNQTEYIFNYQCLFLISCFGSGAKQLLNHFKQTLSFERVRSSLYTNSSNLGVFQRSRNVIESPVFLETDYEEVASMEITLNFKNIVTDLSSTVVESILLNGNLEGTNSSTPITVTTTIP